MKRILAILLALLLALPSLAAADLTKRADWEADVAPYPPHENGWLPDTTGYHDDSLDVRIEVFRRDDTTVMAMFVTISDPSQLRTALCGPYPRNNVTSAGRMAKRVGAVAACSGDYFIYHNEGIVVRNGQLLRNKPSSIRDELLIDDKGDLHIVKNAGSTMVDDFDGTVMQAFCFGPALVENGVPMTDTSVTRMDCGKNKKTQRIAIGQTSPLSYLIVTCEGPENFGSVGFDLLQMSALMAELGCHTAYNLDGGSSSTIVLKNEKINALSSHKTRSIGDIIYFCTALPE